MTGITHWRQQQPINMFLFFFSENVTCYTLGFLHLQNGSNIKRFILAESLRFKKYQGNSLIM